MKKTIGAMLSLVAISVIGNVYADCETDYIKSKASDGSVLILGSGSVWEIDSIDRIDSALWLPMDDVIVCDDDSIIHKDDGEKVGAKQVR
jgi:hypothetical protein